jgi:hypothetical protein
MPLRAAWAAAYVRKLAVTAFRTVNACPDSGARPFNGTPCRYCRLATAANDPLTERCTVTGGVQPICSFDGVR